MAKQPTASTAVPRVPTLDHTLRHGSVSVEPIDNGHIIRQSHMDSTGQYISKHFFSKAPPKISLHHSPEPAAEPNHMRDAKHELEKTTVRTKERQIY